MAYAPLTAKQRSLLGTGTDPIGKEPCGQCMKPTYCLRRGYGEFRSHRTFSFLITVKKMALILACFHLLSLYTVASSSTCSTCTKRVTQADLNPGQLSCPDMTFQMALWCLGKHVSDLYLTKAYKRRGYISHSIWS